MGPLSASDFNSAIREAVEPLARQLGYASRGKAAPAWSRKIDDETLLFQFRRHPNAVDPYQGGRFQIEFERARRAAETTAFAGRANFDQLLTEAELQRVLEQQNEVISSLPRPPASHVEIYPESLRETYLQGFRPQGRFDPGDLWLRYQTMKDLQGWLKLTASLLPIALERAGRLDPGVFYLGSKIQLQASPLRPTNPVIIKGSPRI